MIAGDATGVSLLLNCLAVMPTGVAGVEEDVEESKGRAGAEEEVFKRA